MTPRTWAEKLARKQTGVTTAQFYYVHALVKEHARAVRIVTRLKRKAYFEESDAYIGALDDILAALQRGRGGKG